MGSGQNLLEPHEKNGPVLLQNVASTALGTEPPDGLLAAHERNGAVLLQNAAPTPLGTQEHSRVHFLILRPGLPLLNGVGAEFIGATRKERPCFAAERGLDRLGHTSLRMVYWRHTKGTALFCCSQSISRSENRGRILPRQILFVKCAFYSGPVADLGGDPFPRGGLH